MASASVRRRLFPSNEYLGWTSYAWLIYLPIFLVWPALEHASATRWILHGCAILLFLASYFRAYWLRDRQLLGVAAIQVALGAAFTAINPGAYVFFVYAASFVAQLDRQREALEALATVWLIGLATALLCHAPVYFWIALSVFVPLIGGVNLHFVQTGRANVKLRLAHDEIEHLAATAERERISRDLHDVLGHTLSLIVLKAELASKLADRAPAQAFREIRELEQVTRTALSEVRDAIRGYRATLADEVGRARSILAAARIEAQVDISVDPCVLSSNANIIEVLAITLREAVTNVARHSGATRATIRLSCDESSATLVVDDNGRGMERGEGAGLRGVRERAESIGGHVTSVSEGGLRLSVTVPLVGPALPATNP